MCNAKCVKSYSIRYFCVNMHFLRLQTFVVWPADLRPAIFHLRRSIAIVAGRPTACQHPSGCLRLAQAPVIEGTRFCGGNQNGVFIICTPSGVQAQVAQRQSTGNTHAVRCAGKNSQGFHSAGNEEIKHGGVVGAGRG